jgi:predicted GH43/DUF377 family glycosyl hydrolase
VKKYINNPIIKPEMVSPSRDGYRVKGAFNPGATEYNGEILLLLRVAENCIPKKGYTSVPYYNFKNGSWRAQILQKPLNDPEIKLKDTRGVVYKGQDYLSTASHIRLARSSDGIHFTVDEKPFIYPCDQSECYGVEDARVTKIDDIYYITYTAISSDGWATSLAVTKDFVSIERKGLIFPPPNKDVSIFPELVNGKYCALHRPHNQGFGNPSIWFAESPDLIHWGNNRCLLRPRDNKWEKMKIGGGSHPVKTDEGWLEIYHGKGDGDKYSLFLVLLDLDEPWKVVKRGEKPFVYPEMDYETEGFFPNVVFSNGLIIRKNGEVLLYYGACDESVCLIETSIDELLNGLKGI